MSSDLTAVAAFCLIQFVFLYWPFNRPNRTSECISFIVQVVNKLYTISISKTSLFTDADASDAEKLFIYGPASLLSIFYFVEFLVFGTTLQDVYHQQNNRFHSVNQQWKKTFLYSRRRNFLQFGNDDMIHNLQN